jgi:hypothetical protein
MVLLQLLLYYYYYYYYLYVFHAYVWCQQPLQTVFWCSIKMARTGPSSLPSYVLYVSNWSYGIKVKLGCFGHGGVNEETNTLFKCLSECITCECVVIETEHCCYRVFLGKKWFVYIPVCFHLIITYSVIHCTLSSLAPTVLDL